MAEDCGERLHHRDGDGHGSLEAGALALLESEEIGVRVLVAVDRGGDDFGGDLAEGNAVAAETHDRLGKLSGSAFDQAYAKNEVAYHQAVNGALKATLIPSADNAELKSLLETGLTLFTEHQHHAEHLAAKL